MKVIKTVEDYQEAVVERKKVGQILEDFPRRKDAKEEAELLDLLLNAYRQEHPVVGAKACPFCGLEQLEVLLHRNYGNYVNCKNEKCRASGPYGETEDQAVERWNEREK